MTTTSTADPAPTSPEQPVRRNREEVLAQISAGVTEACEHFLATYTRHFDPTQEADYLLMNPLCNWQELFRGAGGSNVGVVFIREHILQHRPDLLPVGPARQDLMDGIVGLLNCNPPAREFTFRKEALQRAMATPGFQVTTDQLVAFFGFIEEVRRAQFLPTLLEETERAQECAASANFRSFFCEGAGYALSEQFMADVRDRLEPAVILQRLLVDWESCEAIFSAPGNADYN
ncbi:MAG: hypothetical protein K1X79_04990 [Oligoflexia bacterium]|nr:hypothetical protein [Oligoflexia bacterium]